MSKFIHALEMEDDDDHLHCSDNISNSDNVSLLSRTNGTNGTTSKTTRDALNNQLQEAQSKTKTSYQMSTSLQLLLQKISIVAFIVILIVYGITYRVEEVIDDAGANDVFDGTTDDSINTDLTTNTNTPSATTPITNSVSANVIEPTVVETNTPVEEEEKLMNQIQIQDYKGHVYSEYSKIIPDPDSIIVSEDDTKKKELVDTWGKWKFWDGQESTRPQDDYCGQYANRDIPGDKFPVGAWQTDAVYVNHILNDGEKLISRAKEAILTEYGHSRIGLRAEQLKTRLQMFHIDKIKGLFKDNIPSGPPSTYIKKRGLRDTGGYMSQRSWDGLVRRLLHAIMTNDDFTVVLAGHSAAAGHGNHFHQSYIMQFHKVVAPILARFGVKLITRNMSQGGLGTIQNSIGMKSLYDTNIDILLWDSGMTETDAAHVDLFFRQGLLSGTNKVPLLLAASTMWDVLALLHDEGDADVGEYGTGMAGITEITDDEQAKTVPYAARYLKCTKDYMETTDLCTSAKSFCATCWIDRPDVDKKQFQSLDSKVGGQVKWHPGWRAHQLQGRVLAFTVIDALQDAVQIFSSQTMGGPPLDDSYWHVTDYYSNIRKKVLQLEYKGTCTQISSNNNYPVRLCSIPLNARSAFTPRYKPTETALGTIITPYPTDGYVPINNEKMVYDGPDVHNKCYDLPPNATDVLSIVSGRRRRRLQQRQLQHMTVGSSPQQQQVHGASMSGTGIVKTSKDQRQLADEGEESNNNNNNNNDDAIVPGSGWVLLNEPPGQCDGSYNSICGRSKWMTCPLLGHHDSRGIIQGDEYSGWIIFTLPRIEYGIVLLKVVTYVSATDNWKTKSWTSVNNKQQRQQRQLFESTIHNQTIEQEQVQNKINRTTLMATNENSYDEDIQQYEYDYLYNEQQQQQRLLGKGKDVNDYPETTIFEYAIDGTIIKSLTKSELVSFIKKPQRVVEIMTLLDNPNFEPKDNVEIAMRLRNCGHDCPMGISHIYWA